MPAGKIIRQLHHQPLRLLDGRKIRTGHIGLLSHHSVSLVVAMTERGCTTGRGIVAIVIVRAPIVGINAIAWQTLAAGLAPVSTLVFRCQTASTFAYN
jgi:hypothetical protein